MLYTLSVGDVVNKISSLMLVLSARSRDSERGALLLSHIVLESMYVSPVTVYKSRSSTLLIFAFSFLPVFIYFCEIYNLP